MTVDLQIAQMSRAFTAGRYEEMVARYTFPMPIYVNRAAVILKDRKDGWTFFHTLHNYLAERGFTGIDGRVLSVELPRRGRFRLWTDWTGTGSETAEVLFRTVCFNAGSYADHRTEMLALETRKLPDIERLLEAA